MSKSSPTSTTVKATHASPAPTSQQALFSPPLYEVEATLLLGCRGLGSEVRRAFCLILLTSLLLLAACAPSSGGGDPAKVVEQYLTAKAVGDEAAMRPLLCDAMEADLHREASSFASLEVKVEGLSCQRQGDTNVVTCAGKYVVTYGTENSDFPFSSYSVVQEDGAWKWCGEAP